MSQMGCKLDVRIASPPLPPQPPPPPLLPLPTLGMNTYCTTPCERSRKRQHGATVRIRARRNLHLSAEDYAKTMMQRPPPPPLLTATKIEQVAAVGRELSSDLVVVDHARQASRLPGRSMTRLEQALISSRRPSFRSEYKSMT